MTISTLSTDQTEIINNIITLHVPQGYIDCDATYSKGNFYKNITPPKYKFDKYPQTPDTVQSCATNLPLESNSINCLMFDPPFLATTGKSLQVEDSSNIINKRFGVFPNEHELHTFYINAMKEFHRVLADNGILIFKCQDKVSSGKQYMSHVFIINEAEKLGFYTKDLFILEAKSRLISGKVTKQIHARKFHSYFIVFEKNNKKIQYIKGECPNA